MQILLSLHCRNEMALFMAQYEIVSLRHTNNLQLIRHELDETFLAEIWYDKLHLSFASLASFI